MAFSPLQIVNDPTPLRVCIIGAGRIGRTLANLLHHGQSNALVTMWDLKPEFVPGQPPIATQIPAADLVLVCTPSWAVRTVLGEMKPLLRPGTAVVTLAKGVEQASGATMHQVAAEVLGPRVDHAVLGGPMLAEALEGGHRGIGVVGSTSRRIAPLMSRLFLGTAVEIQDDPDGPSVAWCGCLKNVYAFIVGLMHAQQPPTTVDQSFAVAKAEFIAVGQALNIPDRTLFGPAGLGDFEETATSPASHNFHCGVDSAVHRAIVCTSEGTLSVAPIISRLEQPSRFPLLNDLHAVLTGKRQLTATQLIDHRV